jgi:hypothetical protein
MKYIFSPLFFLLPVTIFNWSAGTDKNADKITVNIFPVPYDKAFPNPLKGFRASSVTAEDYPTLTRLYVKWNEIENNENDGVEKIISYCNSQWKDLPKNNIKVIPRVYLEWPYSHQTALNTRDTVTASWGDTRYVERFWPADIKRGDYTSDNFKKRLLNLVAKMGKAWDNDPRVAYIEMGLIGWWGEQHTPYIDGAMQKLLGDAFTSAFKTKLVMVRQAKDFVTFRFGSYWDSFGHIEQQDEADMLVAYGDKWKTTVRGGEVAYDWGDMTLTGKSPDSSLKLKACRDYMIDYIRKVHCNHLGWINNYNKKNDTVAAGAAELQNNLGYNFMLNQFTYTPNILPGDSLHINFAVTNIGSSPFYYNWPVEVSLLNPETKQPVWKAICNNLDIRTWLPGDKWDNVNKKYTIVPNKNAVTTSFKIPQNMQAGEYIIALSILDPAGNLPCVRFSIKNYFKGGRHPMGKIGVAKKIKDIELNDAGFDDLYSDRSLHYEFNNLPK